MTTVLSKTCASRALAIRQNRKTRIKRVRITRRLTVSTMALLSLAATGLLGLDYLFRPDTLIVDRLAIKGSFKYLEPTRLLPQIEAHLGRNFFTLDLEAIKSTVDSEDWVESSAVRRQWPDTLSIEIKESIPVMRWKTGGWLTLDGRIAELPGFENYSAITVFGPSSQSVQIMHRSYTWADQLSAKGLHLVSVNVSDWQSWHVVVLPNDGVGDGTSQHSIEVSLGTTDLDQRFDRFLLVYQMGLITPNSDSVFVDMRYPDGLAVAGVHSFDQRQTNLNPGLGRQI